MEVSRGSKGLCIHRCFVFFERSGRLQIHVFVFTFFCLLKGLGISKTWCVLRFSASWEVLGGSKTYGFIDFLSLGEVLGAPEP